MGKKILVTGGAGFMGSALVHELVGHGDEVFVYDNFVTGNVSNLRGLVSNDRIMNGDVESWKFMKAVSKIRPEIVYHIAAEPFIPLSYEHPERFIRTNLQGTLNVLTTCKTFEVGRVVHYSTSEVYGSARTIPMNEQHPTNPQSVYAVSKAAADNLCQVLAREQDLPVVIVRPFNCYGPRETHPYVIAEIISQLTKSNQVVLGNLDARRDFTYVEDAARAVAMLSEKDGINGQVFNIGFGKDYSIKEIVEKIGLIMVNGVVKISVDESRLRPYDLTRLVCDSSKVRNITGWKPEVSFDEGLGRTIDWYKKNGCLWEWERKYFGPK